MAPAIVHVRLLLSVAMVGGFVTGCAGIESRPDVSTVPAVDLTRYAGTWYEIARLPMWFQRHCVHSKAIYALRAGGTMGVHNECITAFGEVEAADGVAVVVDPRTNARLHVVFDNWFSRLFGPSREGNYWILDLDSAYRTAVVGTPDRRHLWILAREPQLEDASYQRLVEVGRKFGYPVAELIRNQRPGL
jgi:apolipoprotein D and lipocalin family protein